MLKELNSLRKLLQWEEPNPQQYQIWKLLPCQTFKPWPSAFLEEKQLAWQRPLDSLKMRMLGCHSLLGSDKQLDPWQANNLGFSLWCSAPGALSSPVMRVMAFMKKLGFHVQWPYGQQHALKGKKKINIRFCRGDDLFLFCEWSFPIIFLMKAPYLINSGLGRSCHLLWYMN